MRVVGYHITDNIESNSDGEINQSAPWLDFLMVDKGECIKVFYHMDYSIACLLRMLKIPEKQLRELAETTDLEYKGYEFQYIPKRWFAVRYNKEFGGFSDMSQYTESILKINQDNHGTVEYAISARDTGYKVYGALHNLGLNPKSLTSPISAYNKEVLSNIDLPTVDDMPPEVAWMSYKCCKGPWIECFRRGHFNVSYDYDIKSAYGSELAKLLDTRYGKWIQSKEYIANSIYGYCRGIVTINSNFSPIVYSDNSEHTFTPVGTWETYLTKNEIDFINKWKLGNFEIEDGWWWKLGEVGTNTNDGYNIMTKKEIESLLSLKTIIHNLYIKKEQASTDFEANIIKRIISGIWGKLLETYNDGFGANFNPVWASQVETNVRLKVAEFVLANNMQDHVLSVTVDGVLLDKPV